jgi:TolB-like protein
MAAPAGFEHHIFISYRQNDNRSGWVTEFVKALEEELAATIKQSVSIYFDVNPHDGLLAHHDVDDTLKRKLKCLVFIPILSRTYCDARSFAWQHEFKAFVLAAREDAFGLKVSLRSGNVASRVLPVRIHELEPEDSALIEAELQAVPRPIDFIFKTAGVNRPLLAVDRKEENQFHTQYRDQINKVALAVAEIVAALESPAGSPKAATIPTSSERPKKAKSLRIASAVIVSMLVLFALGYYFTGRADTHKDPGTSGIAILPFHNNTGVDTLGYIGVGIASAVRTTLSLNKQFKNITAIQGTLAYVNTDKSPKEIGQALGVDFLLSGLYQREGIEIRAEAELIEVATGEVWWTQSFKGGMKDLFEFQDGIAREILRKFSRKIDPATIHATTSNVDAQMHYLRGTQLLDNTFFDTANVLMVYRPVLNQYELAIELDSAYLDAWTDLISVECFVYQANKENREQQRKVERYYQYFNHHFDDSWQKKLVNGQYAFRVKGEYSKALALFNDVLKENPENVHATYAISGLYSRALDFPNAVKFAAKQIHLNPAHPGHWANLASILQHMGDSKHAYQAILRSWNLSRKKNAAQFAAALAVLSGTPLEQLPADIKKILGYEYDALSFVLKQNWSEAKRILAAHNDHTELIEVYFQLGKLDSAKYQAAISLKKKQIDSAYYCLYACEAAKAKALYERGFQEIAEPGFNRLESCYQLLFELEIYRIRKEYDAATAVLEKLNRDFPTYGNYDLFERMPEFNKMKKEFPPFQKALNNIRRPPVVNVESYIRL